MRTITKIAGLALSALVATTAIVQAGQIGLDQDQLKIKLKSASCAVAGSPAEFPDDIYLTNAGFGTLKAGTKIKWSVTGTNRAGQYTLSSDLAKGSGVSLSGVLSGGVEAGKPCKATVL